jgi:hypothetical protein
MLVTSLTLILGLFLTVGCDYDVRLAVQDSVQALTVGLVDAVFLAITPEPEPVDNITTMLPDFMDVINKTLC